jgi:hypothetical protein
MDFGVSDTEFFYQSYSVHHPAQKYVINVKFIKWQFQLIIMDNRTLNTFYTSPEENDALND